MCSSAAHGIGRAETSRVQTSCTPYQYLMAEHDLPRDSQLAPRAHSIEKGSGTCRPRSGRPAGVATYSRRPAIVLRLCGPIHLPREPAEVVEQPDVPAIVPPPAGAVHLSIQPRARGALPKRSRIHKLPEFVPGQLVGVKRRDRPHPFGLVAPCSAKHRKRVGRSGHS